MYSLYVSPAAQSDVRAAFHWYESQRHGLGREFIENLDTLIQQIRHSPDSRPAIEENVRLALVKRFPYVVCYLFEDEVIHVFAVFHGHRDSSVWLRRIP